ncbi:MAG: hypothetical protein M3Y81_25480 [Chloroflexota bacterium]|nr:hypothetical protein [Chloroflexota bacterium]
MAVTEQPRPVPPRAHRYYHADVAAQTDAIYDRGTAPAASKRPRHTFVALAGMVVCLSVIVLWLAVVAPWWVGITDQWNYGNSRLTQLDADVGHNGTSHFIAEYYHHEIVIIELPLSNPNTHHVYTMAGLYDGKNQPVILLSIADANHDGKPDLVVAIKDTNFQTVLYNNGTAFSGGQP